MEIEKRRPGRPRIDRGVSEAGRPARIPLGALRQKLKVHEEDQNMVRRWINDTGGRLDDALESGYRFVENKVHIGTPDVVGGNMDPGARTSRIVGKKEDGSGLRSYLMEIDRETYEQDQEVKEEAILATEAQIRAGNIDGKAADGRYIPSEGIRLRS